MLGNGFQHYFLLMNRILGHVGILTTDETLDLFFITEILLNLQEISNPFKTNFIFIDIKVMGLNLFETFGQVGCRTILTVNVGNFGNCLHESIVWKMVGSKRWV